MNEGIHLDHTTVLYCKLYRIAVLLLQAAPHNHTVADTFSDHSLPWVVDPWMGCVMFLSTLDGAAVLPVWQCAPPSLLQNTSAYHVVRCSYTAHVYAAT